MIAAIVTVRTATSQFVYEAIGSNTWSMEAFARKLVDEPCSVTVVVQK